MARRDVPGDALSRRLMSRADPGLNRRRMPDGGEVVSGPVATRALQAVGARAMTMDNTIFVDESFDDSDPTDQALYAHERHHQMESGGTDLHAHHDAEEQAAQSIERMVLHRAEAGEDFATILRDVASGAGASQPAGPASGSDSKPGQDDGPKTNEDLAMAAYNALRGKGLSHAVVVDMLARHVVQELSEGDNKGRYRGSSTSLTL